MAADFVFKAGATHRAATDTLSNSDGTAPNLAGATVQFVVRSLTALAPLTLTGLSTITNVAACAVQYSPSATDLAPGDYMAVWFVTYADGSTDTFPQDGWLSVEVQDNLMAVGVSGTQQLVSLPTVKDHLNIPAGNRSIDAKLLRWIRDVRPVVEQITGPIIVQQFEEWKDGGNLYVSLNHSPSTGYGTTPVLNLMACSEYIVGVPTEWSLAIVDTPDKGTMYSCQLDLRRGRVIRRTAGGATQPFPAGPNTVHVIYQAGQATVPDNVTAATLEMVRINYRPTMAVGRGAQAQADDQDTGPPLGFYVSKRCREMLSPNRRHPSFA